MNKIYSLFQELSESLSVQRQQLVVLDFQRERVLGQLISSTPVVAPCLPATLHAIPYVLEQRVQHAAAILYFTLWIGGRVPQPYAVLSMQWLQHLQ